MASTLIKEIHIIDPAQEINEIKDILFDTHILKIDKNINIDEADNIIDGKDLVLTPGLIDFHTHLFYNTGIPASWGGDWCIPPDLFSFTYGVTSMVDAGSAGWRTFDTFYANVISRAKSRVFSFLNIASYGMISGDLEQNIENDFDLTMIKKIASRYSDIIIGIKTAHYEKPDWLAVDKALEAGDATNLPAMIDFGFFKKERPYWEMLDKLRPGDISTHVYRGPVPLFDEAGILYPYLLNSRERGILFDVGHGGGSFIFQNAQKAIQQGFTPDIISTDLHLPAIVSGNLPNFCVLIDKFLALGMSLYDIIKRCSYIPAKAIGKEELGSLQVGTPADISIWRVIEKKVTLRDCYGYNIEGTTSIECLMSYIDGQLMHDKEGLTGDTYLNTPNGIGIRQGEYLLLK